MIRRFEVEAHQAKQRVQELFGLAKRHAEDDPQRQDGQDRQVRVPPLASAQTIHRWCPGGDRLLAQPDRDVAAPEATLVLAPVPDSVLRLVLAVDSTRLSCGHDVAPSISMMHRDPEPMLAWEPTPIHAPTPPTAIILTKPGFPLGVEWEIYPNRSGAFPSARWGSPDFAQALRKASPGNRRSTIPWRTLERHVQELLRPKRWTRPGRTESCSNMRASHPASRLPCVMRAPGCGWAHKAGRSFRFKERRGGGNHPSTRP